MAKPRKSVRHIAIRLFPPGATGMATWKEKEVIRWSAVEKNKDRENMEEEDEEEEEEEE